MSKQDKYEEKIKKLNLAWQLIRKGIQLIKEVFPKDKDVDYFWWKLNKANDKMQSTIYKKMQSKYINDEWLKMIKRLKKE